ncbi:hypothetical protein V2W30_34755 [Streptomyces sp. Q6]|uniref:Uncharacterized protein n=1 Tax=Streptomyces citrinus TaxID=3118173 RepID=A0ACD5AL58_9ACTN
MSPADLPTVGAADASGEPEHPSTHAHVQQGPPPEQPADPLDAPGPRSTDGDDAVDEYGPV